MVREFESFAPYLECIFVLKCYRWNWTIWIVGSNEQSFGFFLGDDVMGAEGCESGQHAGFIVNCGRAR